MTGRDAEEYRELRATIRERATTRVWIFVVGLVAWAGLVIATAALAALPVATLLPLLVLMGVFEAVFALHTDVEQIGRYLRANLEETSAHEHAAASGGGSDPLFTLVFVGAAILNFVPVLIAEPVAIEVAVLGFAHVLAIVRIVLAWRAAGR